MPLAKTLAEYLSQNPDAVLPCICDDSSELIAYGHSMSCPKSPYYEAYKSHSSGLVLALLQGQTCQEWIPNDPNCEDVLTANGKECGEPAEYYSCDWYDATTGKPSKPVCAQHKCRHNTRIGQEHPKDSPVPRVAEDIGVALSLRDGAWVATIHKPKWLNGQGSSPGQALISLGKVMLAEEVINRSK